MDFGTKMRIVRALRNMSQVELSAKSGVAMAFISRAERGKHLLKQEAQFQVRMALSWPETADQVIENLATFHFEQ